MNHALARRHAVVALLLAGIVGLGACGGSDSKSGGTPPPTQPPTLSRVDVSSAASSITVQQTVQLSAIARYSDGSTNTAPAVTWTSSASGIASVSASGLVTGVGAGTAILTGTVGAQSGTVTITVTSGVGVLATVVVSLTDTTAQLAQTTQAFVAGRDITGASVAIGTRVVTWSSSNTTIATVTASGVVTGVGIGSANITVSVADNGVTRTGNTPIRVVAIPGAPTTADIAMPGLLFSPVMAVVKQGGTVRFIFPALAHNVFWDPALTGAPAPPADINTIASQVVTRAFPSVGVFPYKCRLHPGMDGTIVVSP